MKKGFTLVELLAVIIILSIIALITTISVTSIISDSKNELSDIQKRNIESAAEAYYIQEGMDLNASCVSVDDLLTKGYLKGNSVKDPKDNTKIEGSVKITVDAATKKTTYEYQKQSCTPPSAASIN